MKAYITFLAALVVFFIFYNSPLSGTALALGIAVPAVMYTGLLITSRKLSIEVKLPSEPVRNGIPTAVITNRSIFAFPRIVLKAEYTHSLFTESHTAVFHTGIPAKSVQAVTVNSPVRNEFNSYCGTLRVHIKKLCLYDCFGIFKINLKAGQILSTDILPKFYEIDLQADLHTEETESNEFSQHIPGNDPSEVFAVREYREGDRVNTVHWKLSSRTDKLAVKQFSLPIDEGICLMPICVSDRRQAVPADKEKIKTERGLKRRGYRTAPARAGKENGEAAKAVRSLKRRGHRAASARAGKENSEAAKAVRSLKRRGYRTVPARAGKENGEAAKAVRGLKNGLNAVLELFGTLSYALAENEAGHRAIWYDPVSQKNVSGKITDEESLLAALKGIYAAGVYTGIEKAFDFEDPAGRIICISPICNKEVLLKVSEKVKARVITFIYINTGSAEGIEQLEDSGKSYGINVICVSPEELESGRFALSI